MTHKELIMIRTYNSEKTLGETLEKALSLLPEAHIIIADDGSEDKTKDVIKTFKRTYPKQIHPYFFPHRGVSATFKDIVKKAHAFIQNDSATTIACFSCDSDDFLDIGVIPASEKIKEADLCFLPFKREGVLVYGKDDSEFYNWVPKTLANTTYRFDELHANFIKKFTQRVALGYPFKAISGRLLSQFCEKVIPYFSDTAQISEDLPSILLPLFKNTTVTGVNENGYRYIKRPGSTTWTETVEKTKDKIYFSFLPMRVYQDHSSEFIPETGIILEQYMNERLKPFIKKRIQQNAHTDANFSYTPEAFEKDWLKIGVKYLDRQPSYNTLNSTNLHSYNG